MGISCSIFPSFGIFHWMSCFDFYSHIYPMKHLRGWRLLERRSWESWEVMDRVKENCLIEYMTLMCTMILATQIKGLILLDRNLVVRRLHILGVVGQGALPPILVSCLSLHSLSQQYVFMICSLFWPIYILTRYEFWEPSREAIAYVCA